MPEKSYRQKFASDRSARFYNEAVYGDGSYSSLLWQIERRQLAEIVDAMRAGNAHLRYLDFACGTGRVTEWVCEKVGESVGVDISESMVKLARERAPSVSFHCADITDPASQETVDALGKFELITAFRFLLRAEPTLRRSALRVLASLLRDRESRLVVNNHGNLWSHKALMWPQYVFLPGLLGKGPTQHYLTHAEMTELLDEAGLEIESVHGCGVLGASLQRFVPSEPMQRVEERLADSGFSRLGVNQLYVARRRGFD